MARDHNGNKCIKSFKHLKQEGEYKSFDVTCDLSLLKSVSSISSFTALAKKGVYGDFFIIEVFVTNADIPCVPSSACLPSISCYQI